MFEDLKGKYKILKEVTIKPNIANFYINKNDLIPILKYLKTSTHTMFERINCIVCKDTNETFELTYILYSDKYNCECAISYNITYEEEAESICNIFKSANWEEREIFDLYGIKFTNHPNLKRILLPNSFKGYPLRKNYKMDDERLMWNYD